MQTDTFVTPNLVDEFTFPDGQPHIKVLRYPEDVTVRIRNPDGDSITPERQEDILWGLLDKAFEPTVVLGIGSYTYQHVTRDTFGFAMKATYGEIGGSPREIFKSPKTDPSGEKKSAKGLLQVVADGDSLKLRDQATKDDLSSSLLQPVFRDGAILKRCSFKDVRNTLWPLGF